MLYEANLHFLFEDNVPKLINFADTASIYIVVKYKIIKFYNSFLTKQYKTSNDDSIICQQLNILPPPATKALTKFKLRMIDEADFFFFYIIQPVQRKYLLYSHIWHQ